MSALQVIDLLSIAAFLYCALFLLVSILISRRLIARKYIHLHAMAAAKLIDELSKENGGDELQKRDAGDYIDDSVYWLAAYMSEPNKTIELLLADKSEVKFASIVSAIKEVRDNKLSERWLSNFDGLEHSRNLVDQPLVKYATTDILANEIRYSAKQFLRDALTETDRLRMS
ncbi:hypothetical protein [Marinicauda salina]|uniref:hypothetical protein n=1 Tax=Marinicauda salina TaxID=2135793 RepID=UPI0011B264AD|nr:hypothetical protein [Marinicauda salina]